jgi:hypothetical protein
MNKMGLRPGFQLYYLATGALIANNALQFPTLFVLSQLDAA